MRCKQRQTALLANREAHAPGAGAGRRGEPLGDKGWGKQRSEVRGQEMQEIRDQRSEVSRELRAWSDACRMSEFPNRRIYVFSCFPAFLIPLPRGRDAGGSLGLSAGRLPPLQGGPGAAHGCRRAGRIPDNSQRTPSAIRPSLRPGRRRSYVSMPFERSRRSVFSRALASRFRISSALRKPMR